MSTHDQHLLSERVNEFTVQTRMLRPSLPSQHDAASLDVASMPSRGRLDFKNFTPPAPRFQETKWLVALGSLLLCLVGLLALCQPLKKEAAARAAAARAAAAPTPERLAKDERSSLKKE